MDQPSPFVQSESESKVPFVMKSSESDVSPCVPLMRIPSKVPSPVDVTLSLSKDMLPPDAVIVKLPSEFIVKSE